MTAEKVKRFIERLIESGFGESKYFMDVVNEFYGDIETANDFSKFSKKYLFFEIVNGELVRISLLGANNISSINEDLFTKVENVRYFRIHDSDISNISPRTFENMPKLRLFSSVLCKIKTLPQNLFINNPNLQHLILVRSPLVKINKDLCQLPNLTYVDFSDTKLPKPLQRSFEEHEILKFKELVLKYFPD